MLLLGRRTAEPLLEMIQTLRPHEVHGVVLRAEYVAKQVDERHPGVGHRGEAKGGIAVAGDLVPARAVECRDGEEELQEGDDDLDDVVAAVKVGEGVGVGAERSGEEGEAAPVPRGQLEGGGWWLVVFKGRSCGDDDEVVAFGELAESVDAGRADPCGV